MTFGAGTVPTRSRAMRRTSFLALYLFGFRNSSILLRMARTLTKRVASKKTEGIGLCNSITITDNAIIPLKERVVDRFFDPLGALFRVFRP